MALVDLVLLTCDDRFVEVEGRDVEDVLRVGGAMVGGSTTTVSGAGGDVVTEGRSAGATVADVGGRAATVVLSGGAGDAAPGRGAWEATMVTEVGELTTPVVVRVSSAA